MMLNVPTRMRDAEAAIKVLIGPVKPLPMKDILVAKVHTLNPRPQILDTIAIILDPRP